MKTQIIQLDSHDDYISARDKMGWSQASRILLVWPADKPVLRRQLDLVLLQRHSNTVGAQLALVTRDHLVCDHARQVGLPVFKSIRQAQSSPWRLDRSQRRRMSRRLVAPDRTKPDLETMRQDARPISPEWLGRPFTRLAFFTIGVLAFLSIAAVLVPSAQLSLTPLTKTQEITLVVRVDPEAEIINLSGVVPARATTVEVEGRSSKPTSGEISLPDQYASGLLTFTNLSDEAVHIPEGTVVRSTSELPIRFHTTKEGEVPAGVGETTSIPARATNPGRESNLTGGSLVVIEGPLGLTVTVHNALPTSGGTTQRIPAPSDDDRADLYSSLEKSLHQTALKEIQSTLGSEDWFYSPSLTLTEVLESVYDPKDDQPADQLGLELRLEYQGLSVSGEDVSQLATDILNANLPDGYAPLPSSPEIEYLTPLVANGTDRFSRQIHARREIQAQIGDSQAINLTLGLTPTDAVKRLANTLPLEGTPQLTLNPSWWPRLPYLPFRISVEEQ
jgi:hypothetical protein